VGHQKGRGGGGEDFCWANHAFRVHADVESGDYRYECRQWEHTCMDIWYQNPYNLGRCNRIYIGTVKHIACLNLYLYLH
jgi:hypothetical protein